MEYSIAIVTVLTILPSNVITLSYFIEPQFINEGQSVQQACYSTSYLTLRRFGSPCITGCAIIGCDLTRENVTVECKEGYLGVTIQSIQSSDYGEWTCSDAIGNSLSVELKEFDISVTLDPMHVEVGDWITVSCMTANPENAIILRDNVICAISCSIVLDDGCNQEERTFNTDCLNDTVIITVNPVVEPDFATWTCADPYGDDRKNLHQFVAVSLTYTKSERELVEGQQYTFTCQATDGHPGSVIKWEVNGVHTDDGLQPQVNSTGTQISSFILTAERKHSTIQCIAEQVHNKDPVLAALLTLDVLYPPLKATPVQPEVISVVNRTTKLECRVEADDAGYPDSYIFTWTQNGDASFNATNEGTLVFIPSSQDNQDIYHCTPQNTAGIGLPGEIYLLLKESPVISSLTQLQNSTSTVVSLAYYLNSTGGSTSLSYSVWYRDTSGDSSGVIDNIQIPPNHGDIIHVNVKGLIPNTTYSIFLVTCDTEDSLCSDNVTITAKTTESPLITLESGKLEIDQLTIQWQYVSVPGQTEVTVCMEYWTTSEGRDESKYHPEAGLCDIPVENRMMTVLGSFVSDETYKVFLHVSENGFPGTASGQQQIEVTQKSSGMPAGDIAAITLSVLFSVFLIVFIVLLFLHIINIRPMNNCRGSESETDKANSGQTGRIYEHPGKTGIYANQNFDDQTYEQLKGRHSTNIRDSQIELNMRQKDSQEQYMETSNEI